MTRIVLRRPVAFLLFLSLAFGLLFLTLTRAEAQTAQGFRDYLPVLEREARAAGVSESTISRVLPTLDYLDSVVRLDRSQPGGSPGSAIPPFEPYRQKHVTWSRISLGRDKLAALRPTLARIEQETGVPAAMMIAIYGKESNYGGYTGSTDTLSALATLAYEGRRREFFTGEFLAAMKMVDNGVSRYDLQGSWAGAMGKPQFMPSVYLRLARDGDGDGRADIWNSEADAMASIANYFRLAGWRRGEPWGVAVNVPSGLDRDAIRNRVEPQRCPRVFERHSRWLTMDEWRALGVAPQSGYWPGDGKLMAALLEPDGTGRTAYLLTGNYRVILDYNCSNFYALTVGLLADEIGR